MIIGYRTWKIVELNGEISLKSPAHHSNFYYEPGETHAFCDKCTKAIQFMNAQILTTQISEDCTCGIYSRKSPRTVVEEGYGDNADIIGEVILHGDVIEGEYGFRAEKATISRLFLPTFRLISEDILLRVAEKYQCVLVKTDDLILYHMIEKIRSKRNPNIPAKKPHTDSGKGRYGENYSGEPDINYAAKGWRYSQDQNDLAIPPEVVAKKQPDIVKVPEKKIYTDFDRLRYILNGGK